MGAPAGYKAESPDSMALALRPTIYNPSTNLEELDFGKRRRVRRYNVSGSSCNRKSKKVCRSTPNCTYTKRGCRRRSGTRKGVVYEGPSLPGFGKRRKSTKRRKSSKHHKKLPKALLRKCRKLKIKTTVKKGKKRVPKSLTQLKRQIARKMRSLKRK